MLPVKPPVETMLPPQKMFLKQVRKTSLRATMLLRLAKRPTHVRGLIVDPKQSVEHLYAFLREFLFQVTMLSLKRGFVLRIARFS